MNSNMETNKDNDPKKMEQEDLDIYNVEKKVEEKHDFQEISDKYVDEDNKETVHQYDDSDSDDSGSELDVEEKMEMLSILSGFSQSTRVYPTTPAGSVAICTSMSTINGSFLSLNGHIVESDLERSMLDNSRSHPKGIYSQKQAVEPHPERIVMDTDSKLVTLLKFMNSQTISNSSKAGTPRLPFQRLDNAIEYTPRHDLNDSGSSMGKTLPQSGSDTASVIAEDDYVLNPVVPHNSPLEAHLSVSPAVLPPKRQHFKRDCSPGGRRHGSTSDIEPLNRMVHRINRAAGGAENRRPPCVGKEATPGVHVKRSAARPHSHSDTDIRAPLCYSSAGEVEPKSPPVLVVAAEIHNDGDSTAGAAPSQSTPQTATKKIPGFELLPKTPSESELSKSASKRSCSDSGVAMSLSGGKRSGSKSSTSSDPFYDQIAEEPDENDARDQSVKEKKINLHNVKSSPKEKRASSKEQKPSIKDKRPPAPKQSSIRLTRGGILKNQHMSTKEYLIARCSMTSFPSSLATPTSEGEPPSRISRASKPKRQVPIYQASSQPSVPVYQEIDSHYGAVSHYAGSQYGGSHIGGSKYGGSHYAGSHYGGSQHGGSHYGGGDHFTENPYAVVHHYEHIHGGSQCNSPHCGSHYVESQYAGSHFGGSHYGGGHLAGGSHYGGGSHYAAGSQYGSSHLGANKYEKHHGGSKSSKTSKPGSVSSKAAHSKGSVNSASTLQCQQNVVATKGQKPQASMFVDIGSCDTDCDELSDFYGNVTKPRLITPPLPVAEYPRNASRMSVDSDATTFMDGPLSRHHKPITNHSKRERKVWKKFKMFKKQLGRIAMSNIQEEGVNFKTLAIV